MMETRIRHPIFGRGDIEDANKVSVVGTTSLPRTRSVMESTSANNIKSVFKYSNLLENDGPTIEILYKGIC